MAARAPAQTRRPLHDAAHAIAFLTIIPVRLRGEPRDLGRAAAWFPLVGALVGAAAAAARVCAEPLLGPGVASILALIVLVAITGALHQDGLADCADGLGVRADRERRLAVMRDSAIGTFGTLALLAWALLLTTALARLGAAEAAKALVTAAVVGRAAALLHARTAAPARRDGLGASFIVSTPRLIAAGAVAIAAAVFVEGAFYAVASAAAGAVVALAVSAWSRRALGGRTGDTLGATIAIAEVAVCLTLLAFATA
jgi:adenosylcobinamide-GDP ribazoletransferase